MASSTLVFRSSQGPWSVWGCACGCSDLVHMWDEDRADCPGPPRFYVRHHQPLGCDAARIGTTYSGEYSELPDRAPFTEEDTPVSVTYALNDDDGDIDTELDSFLSDMFDSRYDTGPT